jgi:thioredoxin reductase (NADPH)
LHSEVVEIRGKKRARSSPWLSRITRPTRQARSPSRQFSSSSAFPQSDVVKDLVVVDDKGFILTGSELLKEGSDPKAGPWIEISDPETSVPGIFAAGDVRTVTHTAWQRQRAKAALPWGQSRRTEHALKP